MWDFIDGSLWYSSVFLTFTELSNYQVLTQSYISDFRALYKMLVLKLWFNGTLDGVMETRGS